MRIKIFAAIAIQLALALSISTNAHAQKVQHFGNVGSWQANYANDICLVSPINENEPLIVMLGDKNGAYGLILSLGKDANWVQYDQGYYVNFKLGNKFDFYGVGTGSRGQKSGYAIVFKDFPPNYINHIGQSNNLTPQVKNSPQLPAISLKGSANAIKMLRQCMVQKLKAKL